MDLVVLVGGHIEKRAAVLAGIARRAGIRADQEGLVVRHRLVDRLKDIGEDGAYDKIDLVAFEQALDFRYGAVRFEFVIDRHNFHVPAGHLAAEVLDSECEAVADLLAERRRRTRQCQDHADLELLLRDRRIGNHAKQGRQPDQLQLLFHHFSPDRPRLGRSPRQHDPSPRQLILMTVLAASKAAAKSSRTRKARHRGNLPTCKRRANCLKPKENLNRPAKAMAEPAF